MTDDARDNENTRPLDGLAKLLGPNEPIPMFSGAMKVEFSAAHVTVEAQADVTFKWHPTPGPRIVATIASRPAALRTMAGPGPVAVAVTALGAVECSVGRFLDSCHAPGAATLTVIMRPTDTVTFGSGAALQRVTFGVANFVDYVGSVLKEGGRGWRGRLKLEAEGWTVTLDARPDLKEIVGALEEQGGYAVTHAGCLERSDGAAFSAEDATGVVDALHLLLSAARGHTVSLILESGEDERGARVWSRWINATVDAWSDPLTWFDEQRPEQLAPMFAKIVARWADDGWRKAAQLAVYWYVLALENASNADTSIVLAFTGLDLLGWFQLVELEQAFSASKFDAEQADERLRRFLRRIGVDAAIPPALTALSRHAATEGWCDGPKALAVLRNATVHPKRRARAFDAPDEARWEASTLSLWYLELGLLHLLGHEGVYVNRIRRKAEPGLEYVPWSR
jgi:hypothetical protein